MTYELKFLPSALKEWRKLGVTLQKQFKGKLAERLRGPRVPKDALHGMTDHYKIKLRSAGYRLVYRVEDQNVTVLVVAVGKRERNEVYEAVAARLREETSKDDPDDVGERLRQGISVVSPSKG